MKFLVRLCLILCLPLAAHAADTATSSRAAHFSSHEAGASQLTLPPNGVGLLFIARDCNCAPFQYTTTDHTNFLVGEQAVGLAELQRQLKLHPNAITFVALESDYKHVKLVRLILPAGGAR